MDLVSENNEGGVEFIPSESFSEFDLFLITNDLEAGDTLSLKSGASKTRGILVGEDRLRNASIVMEDGSEVTISKDTLSSIGRKPSVKVLGRSDNPLKLSEITRK
jgi:hypothetical protein